MTRPSPPTDRPDRPGQTGPLRRDGRPRTIQPDGHSDGGQVGQPDGRRDGGQIGQPDGRRDGGQIGQPNGRRDGQPDGRAGLWEAGGAGVLRLPSGLLVRGRGLRHPLPSGHPPTFGVYLLGRPPPEFGWDSRWVRWPDFRLPADRDAFRRLLPEILDRARSERVEVACFGGRGRTGTALACLAVLDGVPPGEAVAFVRRHYDPRAVETPWQRRFVRAFT